MIQPPGFHSGPNTSAVFHSMQAPRAWSLKIMQRLRRMGFATLKSYSSLFIRQGCLGSVGILLYVDDLVITDADLDEIVALSCSL